VLEQSQGFGLPETWSVTQYVIPEVGRDSVGIATLYGMDGPGSNPGRMRDFSHPSRPALGPTHPPIQWISGFFLGGKAAGVWRWPPTPSIAEVKERVDLYLYSPSEPPWPAVGWTLIFFMLSRNFVNRMPTRVAYHPRREEASKS